jgi:hypothetical protein
MDITEAEVALHDVKRRDVVPNAPGRRAALSVRPSRTKPDSDRRIVADSYLQTAVVDAIAVLIAVKAKNANAYHPKSPPLDDARPLVRIA